MSQGFALEKGAIKAYQAVGVSNITVVGTTLTQMDDMTLTFTVLQKKDVMIFFNAMFDGTTTTGAVYALFVDGVEVVRGVTHDKDDSTNAYYKPGNLMWKAAGLSAGSHTVLIKWSNTDAANTAYQPGATYNRVLQALELGAEQENPIGGVPLSGLGGQWSNLYVSRASATSVTVTADRLNVEGANIVTLSNVNVTAAITTSGANGLDVGVEASNTWYYIWVIYNGSAAALLLSTSSTSPTMPSGYTYKALVSAVRNDGSSNFISFKQYSKDYWYDAWQAMVSAQSPGLVWTAITTSTWVPSGLSKIICGVGHSPGDSEYSRVGNENASTPTSGNALANTIGEGPSGNQHYMWELNIITANTIYYYGVTTTQWCRGFRITALS